MEVPEAEERIVNLALFVAGAPCPVTAEECRRVEGYAAGQSRIAFEQMFERDKRELRAAGLVLEVDRTASPETYQLDREATFAAPLAFSAEELLLLRAAGASLLSDPAFPYGQDLRFALAKLLSSSPDLPPAAPLSALTADENPESQAVLVATLTGAAETRKRVSFTYTNVSGSTARREVEPYGLFAQEGRWYLVGRDVAADALRVFTVPKMLDAAVDTSRPRHADFQPPGDFDVRSWMLMPFQYGTHLREAILRFAGNAAPRARALAGEGGVLDAQDDGSVLWRVPVAEDVLLARWVAENGPGIEILEPTSARDLLRSGLQEVAALHER